MMKKRIIAFVAVLLLALSGIPVLPAASVYAAAPEKTGYWELVEIFDKQSDSLTVEYYGSVEEVSGSASSGFSDVCTITSDGYRFSYTSLEDRLHKGTCKGESGTAVFMFSPLPGARLMPGEKLSIEATVDCSTSGHHVGVGGQVMIDYASSPDSNDYIYFRAEDDAYSFGPLSVWQAEGKSSGGHSDRIGNNSKTLCTTIPKGSRNGADLYIRFKFNAGKAYITSCYHYQWVDTTPVVKKQEETDGKSGQTVYVTETDHGEDDSAESDGDTESVSDEPKLEGPGSIIQSIIQNARSDSGEDQGVGIIAAIILGAAGSLAAAGALGASSGGNKGGDDAEEKKQKTYKMKVYKGFGDGIRKGAKPVTVWARIVEVIDGEEINRPALTEKITVSGSGMTVRSLGVENTYMGAEVSIPADSEEQTATLTFTYTGEGGVFRNNIVFKVLGEPEITFPEISEDGTQWNVNNQNNQVDLIAGAGGVERLRFVITNATMEPRAIRFQDCEGLHTTCEKDPQWQFIYYACIENRTVPIEKENGIFASMKMTGIRIEAEFEDGLTIWSAISVRLFPEGLAVQGKLENERLKVNTLPLENPTEGFEKIFPTVFSLTFACLDESGHAVVAEEPWWTPREIRDDGKYGLIFKENFKYKIKYQTASELAFYPENTLPSMGDPYEVYLHIAVDTGRTGGRDYSADLPLALIGDIPQPPSKAEWNAALERLKKSIRYYGIDNNSGVRQILRHPEDHSAAELENTRYHIIAAGVKFYEEEYGASYKRMDQLYTNYIVVAGSLVKAGDYAIKVLLIKALGKTLGTTAEHIINPYKNMLFNYIGECIAGDEVSREQLEKRFIETLLEGVRDAICETITGDLKAAPENMGYAVAAYLQISFIRHYWGYDGSGKAKGDVYKSVIEACSDLAVEKFKAWLSDVISKGSAKAVKAISNWCGSLFRQSFNGAVQKTIEAAQNKAFEEGMRPLIRRGNVTTAEYLAVRASKEAAAKIHEETMKQFLSYSADKFSKEALEVADIGLASVLNFMLNGKLEDNSSLGFKTKDLIVELLCERLGMRVNKIHQYVTGYNDIEIRFEDDLLKLRLFDWGMEIPVFENMPVFANMIMDYCFGWMEMVWKYVFPPLDEVPDLRDLKEDASRMIETQKRHIDSLKPIEYKYFGK